jgi:hypothetical protein
MSHPQATFAIDASIRRIAATQLGVITVEQAQACGVNRNALARRRQAGALVPVFREVMRLAPFATTPAQRALAAALVVPGSVIAATSAALIHQLPVRTMETEVVLSVEAGRIVRVPGITVVRQTPSWPSRPWMGTRLATPAATLLLLPRFVNDATVERCLDHCLANRLTSVRALSDLIHRLPPPAIYKRSLLLDLLADRSNGMGHRSGTEQTVGRWLRRAGLTGWTRNLKVVVDPDTGEDVEVDFGWDGIRVALEVSPFFTHGSRAKQERDAERRRLLTGVRWHVIEALDADIADEQAFQSTVGRLRSLGAT